MGISVFVTLRNLFIISHSILFVKLIKTVIEKFITTQVGKLCLEFPDGSIAEYPKNLKEMISGTQLTIDSDGKLCQVIGDATPYYMVCTVRRITENDVKV